MVVAILITISLIALGWSLWIFLHKYSLYKYKKSKKYKEKKYTVGRILSLVFGPILLTLYSGFLAFGLGGVVVIDLLRSSPELNRFADTTTSTKSLEETANSEKVDLVAKGYDGSDFDYYALKFIPENGNRDLKATEENSKKVVIFHHGLNGNRYKLNDYIEPLANTEYLNDNSETTFVAYDAIGWSDGVSRGKTMLGVKAAVELRNVIESVNRDLKPTEIILYGVSMGGGSVYNFLNKYGEGDFLEKNNVKKVLVDSGYFDLVRELGFYGSNLVKVPGALFAPMASWMYGLDNGIPFEFNALEVVSKVKVDLMIFHALRDRTVDPAFTCEMDKARNANGLGDRTLTWTVDDESHADLQEVRKNEFEEYINNFLSGNFADKLDANVGNTGCRTT